MHTFSEAAASYVEHGGEGRYLKRLVERFGDQDVASITPLAVRAAMDAGGWKSSAIFLETYAHTIDAGRTVRDRFNAIHHQEQF